MPHVLNADPTCEHCRGTGKCIREVSLYDGKKGSRQCTCSCVPLDMVSTHELVERLLHRLNEIESHLTYLQEAMCNDCLKLHLDWFEVSRGCGSVAPSESDESSLEQPVPENINDGGV